FTCLFMVFISAFVYNTHAEAWILDNTATGTDKIHVLFRNNSIWPGKFVLKIKPAGESKYGVVSFWLFSYGKYNSNFAAGTKIYLINSKEQETLMKGEDEEGKLLIEVKTEDKGKIIELLP
ncbi:MAG TPA: hypothetical protein VIQ31_39095, partial [Phormidium sp.]